MGMLITPTYSTCSATGRPCTWHTFVKNYAVAFCQWQTHTRYTLLPASVHLPLNGCLRKCKVSFNVTSSHAPRVTCLQGLQLGRPLESNCTTTAQLQPLQTTNRKKNHTLRLGGQPQSACAAC